MSQTPIEVLAASLDRLGFEAQELRADVKRDRKQRRWLTAAGMAVAVLLVTLLVQNNVTGRSTNDVADRLRDCTVPGGECYQESAKRTGAAIEQLDQRNRQSDIAIIQCARALPVDKYPPGPAFDIPFEKCVAEKLAAR